MVMFGNKGKVATVVGASMLVAVLAGCSAGTPAVQQDDAGYQEGHELAAPTTAESYDGSEQNFPEGYEPAYSREAKDNEVVSHAVGEQFEVAGTKYTVKAPSKVHASETTEGVDSFLLDVDIEYPEGGPGAEQVFLYSPDGLYTNDLVQMKKEEEIMQKIDKAEEKGGKNTDKLYDELSALRDEHESGTRTYEIRYTGDGTYTFEVHDYIDSKLHRVDMDIALK